MIEITVVCLFVTLWLYRGEALLKAWIDSKHPVKEPTLEQADPMPPDLLMMAQEYKEDWARQQTIDALYERRSKLGDWQKVREATGFNSGTI